MNNWRELKNWIGKLVKEGKTSSEQQSILNSVLLKMEDLEKEGRAHIGQHIVITARTNEHGFEIGQECVVVEWDEFDEEEDAEYGVEAIPAKGGEHWFIRHTDYRLA
ncbi:hypothetical protein ABE82_26520 (plasmid) [Paenibacillus peoriae]|uniref:hypothetical protein n=1 Tax=Paenibacillus peoriae TaxID=59893 RepID=UPI0007211409|nr:hypothetical protein [Paenibacillus peoriae]ALS09970.1 hypothetical protein ABE82_26520 [Paenibacillus peoriae]